jgi:hypothetical protein
VKTENAAMTPRRPLPFVGRRPAAARARIDVLALLTVAATAGCESAGEELRTIVTDSAGITILTHEGPDLSAEVELVEEFRLGGSDTRPEEAFYEVGPGTVAVDRSGRIHVLDTQARHVVVFGGDGSHQHTVGRPGDGPGELGFPIGLTVTAEGEIGVPDISRRGLVRFSPEGEILPTLPFPPGFFGGTMHRSRDGLVLQTQQAGEDGGGPIDVLARLTERDTVHVVELERPELRPIQLESCGMGFSGMPPIFHPTLRWAAAGETLAVAASAAYDVAIFEEGREVRRIRRSLPPRATTERLAIEDLGEGMTVGLGDGSQVVCDPREVVEKRGFAPVIPAVGRIAIDPRGTIWVERGGARDEPRAIDLFTSEGEYEGTLPEGTAFPLAFFPDGRIAASHTDEFDVMRLVVYRPVR